MKYMDEFLVQFLEYYPILKDKGGVSLLEAKLKTEYEEFRVFQGQDCISDFDREI